MDTGHYLIELPLFPNQAMAEERIAEIIAQSNAALTAKLAGVFHQFRARLAPTNKLAKFMGYPMTAGDPTLVEWLDQFDVYVRHTGVSDVDKAVLIIDHLGGCAREEVLCQPDVERHDYGALVALLKLRFAPHETVNSLSAEFYARVQLDGETLAEYSRVLNAVSMEAHQVVKIVYVLSFLSQLSLII